jgi:drug/metabolite transporter (DMT)-like permease
MDWLLITILGQVILVVVALLDKYILSDKKVGDPFNLAFIVSTLSIFSILFAFIGIFVPGDVAGKFAIPSLIEAIQDIPSFDLNIILLFVLVALTNFYALYALFSALRREDASDVVPIVAAATPAFAFIIEHLVLGKELPSNFIWALPFLIFGTLYVSTLRISWRSTFLILSSGLLYGTHWVATKELTGLTSFSSNFLWSKIGFVLIALILLIFPFYRKKVLHHESRQKTKKSLPLVLVSKSLAGVWALMSLKAIELAPSATLVQAVGGLQFVFLLIISALIGNKLPHEFGEKVTRKDLIHKTVSTFCILIGLALLFI